MEVRIKPETVHNHLVRKYAFYYRYDTDEERAVLNRLWKLVNDRLKYLTPTIKPIGYGCSRDGQRRRLYDQPKTPWTGCWPPGSSHQPKKQNCSPTATPPTRPDRPPDRRPAEPPAHPGQGKDRAGLPGQHPHRPTRRPQRHPHQGFLKPTFAGIRYVMHGPRFRGHLDLMHHVPSDALAPGRPLLLSKSA